MNHPSKSLWTGIFILDLSRVQKDNNLGTYLCAAREDRFFSAVRNRLDCPSTRIEIGILRRLR